VYFICAGGKSSRGAHQGRLQGFKIVPLNRIVSRAAIAVLIAVLTTPSLAAEPAGAKIADFTLANGLTVVILEIKP